MPDEQEILDFTLIADAAVTDSVVVLVNDPAAAVGARAFRATLAQILSGTVRVDGDGNIPGASFLDFDADDGRISALSIVTSMAFLGGATVTKILRASAPLIVPDVTAGAAYDGTMTLTGAATGDHVSISIGSVLPPGMILTSAFVSSANTVSLRFVNVTASTITGATYTVSAAALRFA